MKVSINDLKKLRSDTKAGVSDCRQALVDTKGDYKKAKELIIKMGLKKADQKSHRKTASGIIDSYVHNGSKVGVLVELRCETDFVARNSEFQVLAHELCLQITATNPKDVKSLLKQEYIRDTKTTINELVKTVIAKTGENITITQFIRMELGKK